MKKLWKNNKVQFARLLAEIEAVGLTGDQRKSLCDSMDLDLVELDELFERAQTEFQTIKESLK